MVVALCQKDCGRELEILGRSWYDMVGQFRCHSGKQLISSDV